MFENVKKGDVIYVPVQVSTGWQNGRIFYLARKISHVTPKQFEVEGARWRYRKSDGRAIGEGCAYLKTKTPSVDGFDPETELKAYNEFVKKINTLRKLDQLSDINFVRRHERFTPEMIEVADKFVELVEAARNEG